MSSDQIINNCVEKIKSYVYFYAPETSIYIIRKSNRYHVFYSIINLRSLRVADNETLCGDSYVDFQTIVNILFKRLSANFGRKISSIKISYKGYLEKVGNTSNIGDWMLEEKNLCKMNVQIYGVKGLSTTEYSEYAHKHIGVLFDIYDKPEFNDRLEKFRNIINRKFIERYGVPPISKIKRDDTGKPILYICGEGHMKSVWITLMLPNSF